MRFPKFDLIISRITTNVLKQSWLLRKSEDKYGAFCRVKFRSLFIRATFPFYEYGPLLLSEKFVSS